MGVGRFFGLNIDQIRSQNNNFDVGRKDNTMIAETKGKKINCPYERLINELYTLKRTQSELYDINQDIDLSEKKRSSDINLDESRQIKTSEEDLSASFNYETNKAGLIRGGGAAGIERIQEPKRFQKKYERAKGSFITMSFDFLRLSKFLALVKIVSLVIH